MRPESVISPPRSDSACMTHFVVGGVVFLWGRGGVSTGAVRAVTAVTLAVQAESVRGQGEVRGQSHTDWQTEHIVFGSFWFICWRRQLCKEQKGEVILKRDTELCLWLHVTLSKVVYQNLWGNLCWSVQHQIWGMSDCVLKAIWTIVLLIL